MTPCRFFSVIKPTISWIWVSNPTAGESSDARSAKPVRVGVYTSWEASSKKGMTFCQHQPPCHPPCTSTNVAMLASFFTDWMYIILFYGRKLDHLVGGKTGRVDRKWLWLAFGE